ncbi:ABC transporter substrate-binding protein [Pseudorhodoferax soli]|uniref:Amino acid/amide ABC transporter substrate-binding protein (HAAT family) n=1 Tax=Pseudorhodoferax soli TaxID=545864 RepID=A0A368XN51_9BURK|nr:ABC transporter substrate-binding protein [Pseudorhodoferax soli]RCW69403.1 amino acid/amide ABC transporter substrate-binding protein (HAAT family) [Pseudorhodoferax soli]
MQKLVRGAALALTVFGGMLMPIAPAWAQDAFRIAGVLPLSGAFGIIGENMRRGVTIAIEERNNRVLGKPIEVSWDDTETSTQVAVQKTTRALSREVHTVFGEVSSGSTLAMMKLTDQRKIPHIITLSADDRITGSDKSRYAFRTSNTVAMENRMIGEFAQRQGAKKLYAIVADYQVGRDMWAALKTDFEGRGIQVVGMDLTAIGTKDYAVLLDKALRSGADSLMLLVVGGDVVTSLKQGADIGLPQKMRVMGTMLMDETLGQAVGPTGSLGVNSTLRYHYSQETPRNKRFVEAYKAKYKELPSQYAGEAYDGMSWWLDTVESTGVWDKEKWVDAFRTSVRKDSVEGEKRMRACDNQAEQPGLFGIAERSSGDGPIVMKVTERFTAAALFKPCN